MTAVAPRTISSRELAMRVVRDVFGPQERGAQAAFDYHARTAGLDARDRAFAAELAYGAIKHRRLLDWYLKPYLAGRTKPLPPTIVDILRLGIYQLRVMRGVEDRAAVYETVALALRYGHRGTANLVNAVLRRFITDAPAAPRREQFANDDEFLATEYALPTWLVAQWRAVFGERIEPVLAGVNAAPQQALRVNTLALAVDAAQAELAERGIGAGGSPYVAEVLVVQTGVASVDPSGRWARQSEAAAMPVDLLAPQPGERIVELCSGRGNKSVQIVARLADRGQLAAIELDPRKAEHWRELLANAGAHVATCTVGDAREPAELADADGVLIDAPCSGIGVVGRHPEARWRKSADDGARLSTLQRALLAA
ncbi:MAG: transcription antitermination factor NusB, partial [Vulcanimicrobiaceae bacterium]